MAMQMPTNRSIIILPPPPRSLVAHDHKDHHRYRAIVVVHSCLVNMSQVHIGAFGYDQSEASFVHTNNGVLSLSTLCFTLTLIEPNQ